MQLPPIDWVPKPLAAGDFIGGSSDRLLGRTGMSPTDMLIRETAQNAWDARLDSGQPLFELHLRTLHGIAAEAMRTLLGAARGLDLEELGNADITVLEILDRGTTGLDGPTDLRAAREGEPTNYQDLILKLGVPRDDGGGGGTFGFGKTAAYAYSAHGTVIFWTRCLVGGRLQERFIGSAMGDPFNHGEQQFTGRHWWGRHEKGLALPLLDDEASRWGSLLFDRGFEGSETGTSMLIVAPLTEQTVGDRNAGDPEDLPTPPSFSVAARSAVRRNLWPKLTPSDDGAAAPMHIQLRVEGNEVDLGSPTEGMWRHWATALNAVRSARTGDWDASTAGKHIEILPVTWYSHTVGDIALLRWPRLLEDPDPDDDLNPTNEGLTTDRLALMRGRAELVLRTKHVSTSETGSLYDWIAVFKAADDREKDFASAEPPAHDDWLSDGHDPHIDSIVRTVRNKVPKLIRGALETRAETVQSGEQSAAVGMARRLSTIIPIPSSEPSAGRREPGRHRAAGRLTILRHLSLPVRQPDSQEQLVELRVDSSETLCSVRLSVRIASDDPGERESTSSPAEFRPRWRGVEEVREDGMAVIVRPGNLITLTLTGPRRRGLAVDLSIEDPPDEGLSEGDGDA
ncbi:hypothetical protein [Brachybacterium muris]|uniref:ATP-binding protein n=1 Tax=Brachybacterium muris UCD-AY4 TaxID=1249481 RepID=A0A022L016_9MICO|nr:hypothetical protein [Brachybacterium muris]EYT49023.1 hypothetical protein D641_0109700 [Brachybacterium muris UCD-AY4]